MVKNVCEGEDFGDVPDEINVDYALSFVAQTSLLDSYPDTFFPAFIKVI